MTSFVATSTPPQMIGASVAEENLEMCQDLLTSLDSIHQMSKHCIVNKNLCHQLDEKILGSIPVIQHLLDDEIPIMARSYHHLNSIFLKIKTFFQKSSHKSWTNTFQKHSVSNEFQEILKEWNDLCRDDPELTPISDPVLVKIKSNLHLSKVSSSSNGPTFSPSSMKRRGSVALMEGETETVESTLAALRTGLQKKSESLISIALGNIARLSTGSFTRQTSYSVQGGCDLICTSLRMYPNHRTIGEHGALSMHNLCQVPENISKVYDSGGPEALIQILSSHPENVALIREVCHTVDFLCQNDDRCRQKFHQEGLTLILFQSLKTQYQSAEICEICLSTIYELGYEGIPQPLAAATVTATASPSTAAAAGGTEAEMTIKFLCQMTLKIYSFHHDTQIIIRYLAWIFINLSIEPSNHEIMREMEVFQCIIKCLVQHQSDEEICESCLGAIIYLCQDNPINQTAFSYYDISYALGQILDTHLHLSPSPPSPSPISSSEISTTLATPTRARRLSPTATLLVEMTCIAIIQLTSNDHYENIVNLGIPSICKGLVAVIQLNYLEENGPALLREAYGAIRSLCHSNHANTLLMDSFGGSDMILDSLEQHYETMDPDFILTGITALYSLIRHKHTDILDRVIERKGCGGGASGGGGGFTLLIKILKRFLSLQNEVIIENLLLVLAHIFFSFLSQDTSFIESSLLPLSELHPLVISCMELFPANEVVVENGDLLLCDVIQRNDCAVKPIVEWNETAEIVHKTLLTCYEYKIICALGCFLLESFISRNFPVPSHGTTTTSSSTSSICDFVVTALKFHSTSLFTSLMVTRLLKAVMEMASVNIVLVSSCGCCEVLVSIFNQHVATLVSSSSPPTSAPAAAAVPVPLDASEKIDLLSVTCQCLQLLSTKTTNQLLLLDLKTLRTLRSVISLPWLQLFSTSEIPSPGEEERDTDTQSAQSDEEEEIQIYRHAMEIEHSSPLSCLYEACQTLLLLMKSEGSKPFLVSSVGKEEGEGGERVTVVLLRKLISFVEREVEGKEAREEAGGGEEGEESDDETTEDEERVKQEELLLQTFHSIIELDLQDLLSSASPEASRSSTAIMSQLLHLLNLLPAAPLRLSVIQIFLLISNFLLGHTETDPRQTWTNKLQQAEEKEALQKVLDLLQEGKESESEGGREESQMEFERLVRL
jgi:hypothetical protein